MNLRSARLQTGLTQGELGTELAKRTERKASYGQKLISLWEAGKAFPADVDVKALCFILNVPAGSLEFEGFEKEGDPWTFLAVNGVGEEDVQLLRQNPMLHKPLAEAVKQFCAKMRDVIKS